MHICTGAKLNLTATQEAELNKQLQERPWAEEEMVLFLPISTDDVSSTEKQCSSEDTLTHDS